MQGIKGLSGNAIREFVKRNRFFFKLFTSNPLADKWKRVACFTCKGAHHAWLHKATSSGTSDRETTSKGDVQHVVTTHTSIKIRAELGSCMLLTTAIVIEEAVYGKMFPVSVLLDSRSQLFITSTLVMNCVKKCHLSVIGINNMAAISVMCACGIDVFSRQSVSIFKLIMLWLSQ